MNYVKKCNEEFNTKIDAINYVRSEDAEKIDDIKNTNNLLRVYFKVINH